MSVLHDFYKNNYSIARTTSRCKKCIIAVNLLTRNPDNTRRLKREYESRKRARLTGSYTERLSFKAIQLRDKMICGLCHRKVRPKELSFDHIIPLSCGGAHAEWNIQVAHLSCNCRKHIGKIPSQIRLNLSRMSLSL